MKCINCGKADLEQRPARLPTETKGEMFTITMNALVCPNCEYKTVSGSDMPEFMRLAADAYRRAHGLLNSDEIRGYRKRLGMSQERFAAHLQVGLASVKRWELGQIQDSAMDVLIRLRADSEYSRKNWLDLQSPP